MIEKLGIKSMVDIGCGRGISTSWFITHGLEYVVCAEGSHDAVTQSLIPTIQNVPSKTKWELVEHDFSRGPWWPSRTVVSSFFSRGLIAIHLLKHSFTKEIILLLKTGHRMVCRSK